MAMRELTDSERIARDVAKSSRDVPYLIYDLEHYIFNMGFIAALDHSAAQIAALTAERDALRAICDEIADERLEQGAVSNQLRAENTRLREAQFKAVKDLKRMARYWREYAAGDYCQTYNPEMGSGFRRAAGKLEDYINDTIRLATGARK